MAKTALCIGINNYPGTDMDLAGCVNDTRDWARALKQRGFTVSLLHDAHATGKEMRRAIRALLGRGKSGDTIAIHYSGHGSYVPDEDGDEPDGTDECLCPHDVMENGPISDDELFTLLCARPENIRLLFFSDSCHSGTITRFAPILTPPTTRSRRAPQRKVRFLPPATYLSRRDASRLGAKRALHPSSPPGRNASLLLSACQDTEYSYDAWFNGRPNGAFSYVALAALKKLPAGATYKDWHQAIRQILPSQQYPQTPNLYGSAVMKKWKVFN